MYKYLSYIHPPSLVSSHTFIIVIQKWWYIIFQWCKACRLIKGLCKGFLLRKDVVAGFPSLNKLPHMGTLQFHKIIVNQSKSKGKNFLIDYQSIFEETTVEDLANLLLGSQFYVGYPFFGKQNWRQYQIFFSSKILTHTFNFAGHHLIMANHCKTGPRMQMGLSKKFPRGLDLSLAMSIWLFMQSQSKASSTWIMLL